MKVKVNEYRLNEDGKLEALIERHESNIVGQTSSYLSSDEWILYPGGDPLYRDQIVTSWSRISPHDGEIYWEGAKKLLPAEWAAEEARQEKELAWQHRADELLQKGEDLKNLLLTGEACEVGVGFGSPTLRRMREGFWGSPKTISGFPAELRLCDPSRGWVLGNIEVVGMDGVVVKCTHLRGVHGGYYQISVLVVPGTEVPLKPWETKFERTARESGLPEALLRAFNCDIERTKAFVKKVDNLDLLELDTHEMSCGRSRKESEVIRVSGDPDFFLSGDPLEVSSYILDRVEALKDTYPSLKGFEKYKVETGNTEPQGTAVPASATAIAKLAAKFAKR